MRRSLFDELRSQRNPPASVPRLRPNIFARLVRFSWNRAELVLSFWLIFSFIGLLLAYEVAQTPKLSRLPLPLGSSLKQVETTAFTNLASLQTITLSNTDSATLSVQRADLVTALREQHDTYELVFAPGASDFYDDNAMLFRPLDEVKARVAYALSLRPLFDAIAAAPNAQSMTTLVGEIAGAAQQGRGSQGVSELLNEAASSVESLANGEDKPMDWAKIAELNILDNAQTANILALPKPGQEAAARRTTAKFLGVLRDSSATKAQFNQAAASQVKAAPSPPETLRVVAASCMGIAFASLLLAVFMGRARLVLLVIAPTAAMLGPMFGAVMLLGGSEWGSYWPTLFAVFFGVLLLTLRFILLLAAHAGNSPINQTATMLCVQTHGVRFLQLALTMALPWIALPIWQHGPLILTMTIFGALAIISPACVLTLPVALLRFSPTSLQWRAREWLEPAHRALFETRYWQIVAPALGGLIVLGCFAFSLASSGVKQNIQSDAPVSIIAQDRSGVEATIARLKAFSGARSVRWLGMFLPDHTDEKRAALRELTGQFPRIAPVQSEAPTDLRDQIETMQESLSRIASVAGKDKALADGADQFRRSLALLGASDRDQPITQLENRLFGGFNRLADRAEQLSKLTPIDFDALPPELQSLFGQDKGPYRIEVDAAPGTSNAQLAVSLDQAGFNVMHPAVSQAHVDSAKLNTLIKTFGSASGLILLSLFATFRSFRPWLTLTLFGVAAIVVTFGINSLWQPEQNLTWLLGGLALLTCFGGFLHVALARGETSAESLIELFMLPSVGLALAVAFYVLGIVAVSDEAMPLTLCIFLVALVVGLFHHHSNAALADEALI